MAFPYPCLSVSMVPKCFYSGNWLSEIHPEEWIQLRGCTWCGDWHRTDSLDTPTVIVALLQVLPSLCSQHETAKTWVPSLQGQQPWKPFDTIQTFHIENCTKQSTKMKLFDPKSPLLLGDNRNCANVWNNALKAKVKERKNLQKVPNVVWH